MIPLSDTATRRIGYAVIAVAIAAVPTNVVVSLSIGETDGLLEQIVLGVTFAGGLFVAMRAAPRNAAVWAFVWGGFCGGWGAALNSVAVQRTGFSFEEIEDGALSVAPAALDVLTAMVVNLNGWLWLGYFFLPIHLALLFPTGRASSRTWRWVMWVASTAMAASALTGFIRLGPWVQTPYDEIFVDSVLPGMMVTGLVLLLLVPVAVGNLIYRYRKSSGVERLQFRWLAWALAVLAVTLVSGIVLFPLGFESAANLQGLISTLALAGIPISIGIAIAKYHLYDLDMVISRSLMFVVLVGFISIVYVGVVVGVGSLVGGSSVGWSILATALVAVAFEPVRTRLQRWVNRLVYGQRATPYEVLSDLTGRLAATETGAGLLDRMATRLAEGTGADRAVVWIADEGAFMAVSCEPSSEHPAQHATTLSDIAGSVVPIERGGEVLGALSVEKRRGEAPNPTETRLMEDLAGSAALFLTRRRLDAELEEKAQLLSESRRRLVDAQDAERRRLERQLNEGTQQQVLALKLELGLTSQLAGREGSVRTATLLEQMVDDAQHAIDQIRTLAAGIYPPLLEAEGLDTAIAALAEATPVEVRVDAAVGDRHPLPDEAAVYFAISEALTNATKHAQGPIRVRVASGPDGLSFAVADAGPGFDPKTAVRGAGLNNMTDRINALGGTLTVVSDPGAYTTITGEVPIRAPAPV